MWVLLMLRFISLVLLFGLSVVCLAAGLFYIGELVEEYALATKRILRAGIASVILVHVLLLVFEDVPALNVLLGMAAHVLYYSLLREFPSISFTSPKLFASVACLLLNHGAWFYHFTSVYVEFDEMVGFFFVCVWLVPFTFFISLSAGDNTLPYGMMSSSGEVNNMTGAEPSRKRGSLFMTVMNKLKRNMETTLPFMKRRDDHKLY